MNKEQTPEEKLKFVESGLNEWFNEIIHLHGLPCYIMVRIDGNFKITLLSAGSNSSNIGAVLEQREKEIRRPVYIG